MDASGLCSGFLRSSEEFPQGIALEVQARCWTYQELRDFAASIAATLSAECLSEDPPLTAVFAHRSSTAFAGVLGVLMRGHGYVPLNCTFPVDRTRTMLLHSGCRAMVVDGASMSQLGELLEGIEGQLLVLLPECTDVSGLRSRWPQHAIVGAHDMKGPGSWVRREVAAESVAYILYTSGSTGIPKGVMVSHKNMQHFVDVMVSRYAFTPEDRFSQINDLTFDVSAFDMFVAWASGSTVCVVPERAVIQPGKFILSGRLTLFYSGPSLAVRMKGLGMVKPGQYPNLRYSFFAGEALPLEVAASWQAAAPNSIVENLYGPTELTVTCTHYRYQLGTTADESALGWVPIGDAHPGMDAIIVDDELRETQLGVAGELLLCGPQVSLGYWRDSEKTRAAFVTPPGKAATYYRTGDRVRRDHDGGPLLFLGRVDNQVQIHGFRVELGEVEAALRVVAATDAVVALGWPVTPVGVGGIVAFVADSGANVDDIISRLKRRLPSYMVPREIRLLSELPLNANRKVDRKALARLLEGHAGP